MRSRLHLHCSYTPPDQLNLPGRTGPPVRIARYGKKPQDLDAVQLFQAEITPFRVVQVAAKRGKAEKQARAVIQPQTNDCRPGKNAGA